MAQEAHRSHEWHMGHTLHEHEGKCADLHGHSYVMNLFVVAPSLDSVGRIIDFSVLKTTAVQWLEDNWDHKFLVNEIDPRADGLVALNPNGVIKVPFNPTAENLADHLVGKVFIPMLEPYGIKVSKLVLMETGKCGVTTYGSDYYK